VAAVASVLVGYVALSTAPASAITCGKVTYTLNTFTDSACGDSNNPNYSEGPDGIVTETFNLGGMEMGFVLASRRMAVTATGLDYVHRCPDQWRVLSGHLGDL
jgi:hypothetical protein